jgi:plasmid replication initiation protein
MASRAKQNQLVKESNVVARAKIKPKTDSVWEERIISLLLARVRVGDKVFYEQTLSFEELNEGREMSSREHSEAKRAVDELGHKTYVMPYGWRGIDVYPIFQRILIDDKGNIRAKFNSELCEHFLELRKQFAIRSLPEFRQLSGTYAQQLFRFLNSWKSTVEVVVGIGELHEFLSTPPSFRENFKAFRMRVLEPVHKEISEKTSLSYMWEPIREGLRKVIAVRFSFQSAALANIATATAMKKEKTDIGELQKISNQCFEKLQRTGKKCVPKRTTKRCQFCMTRGRMFAIELSRKAQGTLPFDTEGSNSANS